MSTTSKDGSALTFVHTCLSAILPATCLPACVSSSSHPTAPLARVHVCMCMDAHACMCVYMHSCMRACLRVCVLQLSSAKHKEVAHDSRMALKLRLQTLEKETSALRRRNAELLAQVLNPKSQILNPEPETLSSLQRS
jgi:hypothetical protein